MSCSLSSPFFSLDVFPRGASIRPPEERKEFWTNLFRLPDQERERERERCKSWILDRRRCWGKWSIGIVILYTYFRIVCKWLIYYEKKIVASKGKPFNPRQMETICRVNDKLFGGVQQPRVSLWAKGFSTFCIVELTETLEYHFYGWLSAVGTY